MEWTRKMNEWKIFCSVIVIIFTLGIYSIVLFQYELYKLNNLTSSSSSGGVVGGGGGARKTGEAAALRTSTNHVGKSEKSVEGKMKDAETNKEPVCNVTVMKKKFNLDSLNCGSASELVSVTVQDCPDLPCDIRPNVNYSVILNFRPSRNISSLDIETFVQQRKDLQYLHKNRIATVAIEDALTNLKFSFEFPPHPIFQSKNKMIRKGKIKCPTAVQLLYLLGVEIWDATSGIGEICLIIPMLIQF